MFPSDWSDRKSSQASKRRKLSKKEAHAALLDECSRAAGVEPVPFVGQPSYQSSMTLQLGAANSNSGGQGSLSGDDSGSAVAYANGWGSVSAADSDTQPGSRVETAAYLSREYPDNIVDAIIREVNSSKFAPAIPEELQLDHVLSSVPYQSMLESLFGGLSEAAPDVPLVTRAYEESYMREAGPGEPSCSMGDLCECRFVDKNAPFVGVQFELPIGCEPGKGRERLQMCVLCCRRTTQKLFYDMCFSGERIQGLIQQYGNLCNQPGEYARCCMLICPSNGQWQCMPRPIMSHQRNRYKVHVVAGLKHLQQLRVAYEDFCTPSDTAQG